MYFIRSKIITIKLSDVKCCSSAAAEAEKEIFQHTVSSTNILVNAQQAEPRHTTLRRGSWSANPHSSLLC